MKKDSRVHTALVVLAAVRIVIGLVAIPLAPFLYEKHFVVLVLMRPTKDVLLAGGFLLRLGKVGFVPLIAAAVPLAILGVWHSYFLGRFHASQIRSGRMPWLVRRVLPPKRIKVMQKLLDKKGMRLVVLGRLAVFPSTLVGAAAGAGDVPTREFIPADTIGGLLSIAEAVGAGWALGATYKHAGPWITAAGFAAVVAISLIVARYLKRENPTTGSRKKKSPRRRKTARTRRAAHSASRS